MFKWIKTHGCNCQPLPEGGEKYILNVGDIYCGIVESNSLSYDPKKFSWSASYRVCGDEVSAQSGGPLTRDTAMDWIESRIRESLLQIEHTGSFRSQREIYDALWERDSAGEWKQERLD